MAGQRADDGAIHVRVGRGLGDHGRLAHAPGHFQRFADHAPQLMQVERLEQVVVGALLHRFDGRIRRLGHGDEDDRDPRVDAADLLVDLEPGLVGQAQVEQNDIGRCWHRFVDPFGAGAGHLDPVTGGGKRLPHLLRDQDRVVVDEQHMGHGRLHLGRPAKDKLASSLSGRRLGVSSRHAALDNRLERDSHRASATKSGQTPSTIASELA